MSNPGSPRKSNTPSPKANDVSGKVRFQDNSLNNTSMKQTKKEKTKLKLDLDLLAEKYNSERVFLQIAYTDLKMSHRFVRFTLSQKYKDLSNRDLNKKIADYLKKDNCVEFFRLQDDSEVLNFNNIGIASLYKDIKNSFKLFDVNKKINYSLCIVYDLNKLPQILNLKTNLDNIKTNKVESKSICNKRIIK